MTDQEIIELLFSREEAGLMELQKSYTAWCHSIIFRLLQNEDDTQETMNDLWLQVWNSIPPAKPENLKAYLAKAARNTAIHCLEREGAQKRKHISILLSELSDCVPDHRGNQPEQSLELREALNSFVRGLPQSDRELFVRRYWYGESIAELQARTGWTRSKLTSLLHRLRKRLKKYLEKEGLWCE